jgi:hypothetical protein
MPRARKKQGSTPLARFLIDHCFDGEESPNPDPEERKTYHQRNHTHQLNAGSSLHHTAGMSTMKHFCYGSDV